MAGKMMRYVLVLAAGALALSGQAFAFDCAKASTKIEKAICSSPDAKAADDAMEAAYAALLPQLDQKQAAALKASQRSWLVRRNDNCGFDEAPAAIAACVTEMTKARASYLAATPDSGPGLAKAPLPYLMSQAQTKTLCSADVALYRFGKTAASAGEKFFDAEMDALASSYASEFGKREIEPGFEFNCDYALTARFTYATARFASVSIDRYVYGGGAHGFGDQISAHIDMASGKAVSFSDVFDDSAKPALVKACTAGLRAEKQKRYSDIEAADLAAQLDEEVKTYADGIAETVGNLGNWIVFEDRAEIYFAPYAIGSYAEGSYSCTLPKAEIATLATKGWIVP